MGRDVNIERLLGSFSVIYEYVPKLGINTIKTEDQMFRQIRLSGVLDENHCEQIMEAYQNDHDAPFPPLIIYGEEKSPKLIGGFHRVRAFRQAGKKSHDSYLIKCNDPLILSRIAWADNLAHGKAYSKEERLMMAEQSVINGMSQKDAAKSVNLSLGIINTYLVRQKTHKQLLSLGISPKTVSRLNASVCRQIQKLHRPSLASRVAEIVVTGKHTGEDACFFIDSLNKAENDDAVEKVFDDYKNRLQAALAETRSGRAQKPRNQITLLIRWLLRARHLLPLTCLPSTISSEQKKQASTLLGQTTPMLTKAIKHLNRQ